MMSCNLWGNLDQGNVDFLGSLDVLQINISKKGIKKDQKIKKQGKRADHLKMAIEKMPKRRFQGTPSRRKEGQRKKLAGPQ